MIQITLNFVSLEAARQALLEIPSNLLAGEAASAPKAQKAAATPAAAETKAAKAAPAVESPSDPKPVAAPSAPAPVAAPVASSSEPTAPAVDYPTLQKAVFALAGKSREAAAAVAASLGVKTFKELDQDAWGNALGAVTMKLAELEAA